MHSDVVAQDDGAVSFGCFEVDGRRYGLAITQIREVVRWQPATPLPNAPEWIDGVIDLRGAVIPVVNLGCALGVEDVRGSDKARIVVAQLECMVVGFSVDAAIEVLSVERSRIAEPPALATDSGDETTHAVLRREGESPILVVSLEHLLEKVRSSGDSLAEAAQ